MSRVAVITKGNTFSTRQLQIRMLFSVSFIWLSRTLVEMHPQINPQRKKVETCCFQLFNF
jgi:hypothetical protein